LGKEEDYHLLIIYGDLRKVPKVCGKEGSLIFPEFLRKEGQNEEG